MTPRPGRDHIPKSPILIGGVLLVWGLLAALLAWPFLSREIEGSSLPGWAPVLAGTFWLVCLWWSLHHLAFQVGSLFISPRRVVSEKLKVAHAPKIVVCYLTSDDLCPASLKSCVEQDYPADCFRVIVCDDGIGSSHRQDVDKVVAELKTRHDANSSGDPEAFTVPQILINRRDMRSGHKAGNLNAALKAYATEEDEWIVVVDADQILPVSWLRLFATSAVTLPESVGFAQGSLRSDHRLAGWQLTKDSPAHSPSTLQATMGLEIDAFYSRDLLLRERFGFVPFLGHGGAVLHRVLREIGGFPEVVSEDYALAILARRAGYLGVFLPNLVSFEAYPVDPYALAIRSRKFASGTAGMMPTITSAVFGARSGLVFAERVDLFMQFFSFLLALLAIPTSILSAWVCHVLWREEISRMNPLLPYLFLLMTLIPIAICYSVETRKLAVVRFWFHAQALYGSIVPLVAASLVAGFFRSPHFPVTPKKAGEGKVGIASHLLCMFAGFGSIAAGLCWESPFRWVLWAQGCACLLFPNLRFYDAQTVAGHCVRTLFFVPGCFTLVALREAWRWGR